MRRESAGRSYVRIGPPVSLLPERAHGCEPCAHPCHPVSPHIRNSLPPRNNAIINVRHCCLLLPPVRPLAVTLAVRSVPSEGAGGGASLANSLVRDVPIRRHTHSVTSSSSRARPSSRCQVPALPPGVTLRRPARSPPRSQGADKKYSQCTRDAITMRTRCTLASVRCH